MYSSLLFQDDTINFQCNDTITFSIDYEDDDDNDHYHHHHHYCRHLHYNTAIIILGTNTHYDIKIATTNVAHTFNCPYFENWQNDTTVCTYIDLCRWNSIF